MVLALGAIACADAGTGIAGSPSDGLVYVRVEEGAIDLARVRIRDAAVVPLTRTPDVDETWPYWSEVAQLLVFQRAAGPVDARNDLWSWRPDGAEAPVTETPRRDERWPTWSPVAPRLVYAFRGGSPPTGLAWVKPGGEEPPRVLARSDARTAFFRPRFAPNGELLVAQRRGPGRHGSQLWLVGPGAARPLTRDPDHFALKASFTRGGGRVVFSRRPSGGGAHDVVSVDLEGGDLRRHVATDADEHSSRPSPTRDEVVLISDAEGSYDAWLAPLARHGQARVLDTTPEVDEYAPRWSPDGERIAVTIVPRGASLRLDDSEAMARARIRVLDRRGRVLLETAGVMPDWMPAW